MSGVFAEWQPHYAEKGVVTFPVKNKRPCVKGYNKIGFRASAKLAFKFPDADAFGFMCGPLNGITVVDVDSPDDVILNEAIRLFGPSPVIWRTGGGRFAMPFRHNGETRRIRGVAGLPIDILGDGYAVSPPSQEEKRRYEFLQGGLEDFTRLPVAKPINGNRPIVGNSISIGRRNEELFHFALDQARFVDLFDDLVDVVETENQNCEEPLSQTEIVKIALSAWGYEESGNNLKGRGGSAVIPNAVTDLLLTQRQHDAMLLYLKLKRHHWSREFAITKEMASVMGWRVGKLRRARDVLISLGLILRTHLGGNGPKDPSVYKLSKGLSGTPNKKLDTFPSLSRHRK